MKVTKRKGPCRGIGVKNERDKAPAFRRRKSIRVLECESSYDPPNCPHGPCLLFGDGEGNRWFSCAVYRSGTCPFKVGVSDNGLSERCDLAAIAPSRSYPLEDNEPYWCRKCLNYVGERHNHAVVGLIRVWRSPLKLLDAIREDGGEAQYWFSDDTVGVVERALERVGIDSVLCVGTPSLFERLGEGIPRKFLLDYDDRFSRFYTPDEFARYSMLVHHFPHKASESHLRRYLSRCQRLALLCDPPFGVLTSPLMKSIAKLRESFIECAREENRADTAFYTMIFLPIFVGKHVLRCDPFDPLSMVEFKVDYTNHGEYGNADKSPVRIFTNFPLNTFELPSHLGYRPCRRCDRWVTKENRHCAKCGDCTTKFGPTYRHCNKCGRCVKPKYEHCRSCATCHLRGRCSRGNPIGGDTHG